MGGVLAHQGGWDEIAFVAIPIVVILGLLRLAKYRIDKERAEAEAAPAGTDDTGDEPYATTAGVEPAMGDSPG